MAGAFDEYDDLADLRIAALERQLEEMAEKIEMLCGVVMGLYEDREAS